MPLNINGTMVPIQKRTRERLRMLKTRKDSYDDVINDLIDESLKKPVSKKEQEPAPVCQD
jgi:hypothetical protein